MSLTKTRWTDRWDIFPAPSDLDIYFPSSRYKVSLLTPFAEIPWDQIEYGGGVPVSIYVTSGRLLIVAGAEEVELLEGDEITLPAQAKYHLNITQSGTKIVRVWDFDGLV